MQELKGHSVEAGFGASTHTGLLLDVRHYALKLEGQISGETWHRTAFVRHSGGCEYDQAGVMKVERLRIEYVSGDMALLLFRKDVASLDYEVKDGCLYVSYSRRPKNYREDFHCQYIIPLAQLRAFTLETR